MKIPENISIQRDWRSMMQPGRGRRGMILILVLIIALGLASIVLYFANSMVLEYRASDNNMAAAEARQASEGVQRYLIYLMKQLYQSNPGRMPDIDTYPTEAVPVGQDSLFWLIGRDPSQQQAQLDRPVFGLVDESSKLNLNTVTVDTLELLPNMTPQLAAAIIDWRDSDDDPTENGAESDTYLKLNPPYYAKNQAFETPEELRWIYGMTYGLLYGEDANRNGILDHNENDGSMSAPIDNQDGILDPGYLEYFTVWSREPNTNSDGTQKANVSNTQAMTTLLTNTLGETRATEIMQNVRQGNTSNSGSSGSSGNNNNQNGSNNNNNQSSSNSTATSSTSVLGFYVKSKMTESEFSQIEDQITASDNKVTSGLININTAPLAVLECIPGIGQANASSIVGYRQGKTPDTLRSISWVSNVLSQEDAITAGPYITVHTYQFTADVVTIGHGNRGMQRDLYVIDTADGDPKLIYHRNLNRLGWPLGSAIREELRLELENQERSQ